jgi:hypothetical protein
VTGSDHEGGSRGGRHPTPERGDQPTDPLEEPVSSRATLARRLRAVERALSVTEDLEFESGADAQDPGKTHERLGSMDERLEAVEERTEALCRAVRALGESLVARERARPDDGVESIRRAMEALPDAATEGDGDDANNGKDRVDARGVDPTTADTMGRDVVPGTPSPGARLGGTKAADGDESTTEWLDRAASGGVTPPRVE